MIEIHDLQQQTPEWFAIKKLYPFSSSNAQAIASQGAGLDTLVWEILAREMSSGEREEFTNKHLERGNELEPLARASYELSTGKKVVEVGFVTNDRYKLAGASTDGLVDNDGVAEIKCFEDKKHLKAIFEVKNTGTFTIESGYDWQAQMEMMITERKYCDFILFNPNFEDQLLIKTLQPDIEKYQKLMTGIIMGTKLYNDRKAIYYLAYYDLYDVHVHL
mgnify:CR=1 FL=1